MLILGEDFELGKNSGMILHCIALLALLASAVLLPLAWQTTAGRQAAKENFLVLLRILLRAIEAYGEWRHASPIRSETLATLLDPVRGLNTVLALSFRIHVLKVCYIQLIDQYSWVKLCMFVSAGTCQRRCDW